MPESIKLLEQNVNLLNIFQPKLILDIRVKESKILEELFLIFEEIDFDIISNLDALGTLLQNTLTNSARKRFAANYTDLEPSDLLAYLAVSLTTKKIIDPMGGSGRLFFSSIDAFMDKGLSLEEAVGRISLNEVFLPAIQLFCAKLLLKVINLKKSSMQLINNCTISVGDAFSIFSLHNLSSYYNERKNEGKNQDKYDLVIMNPPFTRQGLLEKSYRSFLSNRFKSYSIYINKHMGLHGYSLFLAHEILSPGGLIATVLPASTIYSDYGEGLKRFLLDHYDIQLILTSAVTRCVFQKVAIFVK